MVNELLEFQEGTRRVWMFPRNIRKITPWKLYKILRVLMLYSDLDQHSVDNQLYLYRMMSDAGIKKEDNTRDANPGGLRTYFAQLEALGLVYSVDSDKSFHYTLAGEAILKEDNPLAVLQCQLMRFQYPSAYGCGQNVRIDTRMRVKPFLFILKLLHDKRIENYLTNEDMVFPVIYGHKNGCYELVVDKILKFRKTNSFNQTINNLETDLYTPRGNSDKALDNIKNIGNTALNYLKAAELVLEDGKVNHKTKHIFNLNYESFYISHMSEFENFRKIASMEEYQSFQRSFGRYNRQKDTRNDTTGKEYQKPAQDTFIQTKYIDYINDHPFEENWNTKFVAEMKQSYGLNPVQVNNAIMPYQKKKRTLEEYRYLEFANSGGQFFREFEKATTNLLRSYGFDKTEWTGSKVPPTNRIGGYADIFIWRSGTDCCGLADTKATSQYLLGHKDILAMENTYCKTYKEIYSDTVLKYCLYIAGGFNGDISNSIKKLSDKIKLPVSACYADAMLAIGKLVENGWTAIDIEKKLFCSGKVLSIADIECAN